MKGHSSFLSLIILAFLLLPLRPVTQAATAQPGAQKAILVTGASTGIGRKITEHLAARGYLVYAGARKESDLQSLGAIKNVQPIRLDVTDSQNIAAAVDTVTKGGHGLYGLINNAGVVSAIGSVVDVKEDEFDLVMNVNVHGPYRVTKAFAPLVIAQKGRIVMISSILGIGNFGCGVYCMSKHALEAFADSLGNQMEQLGVRVSVIEPGTYRSEIEKTAAKRAGIDPRRVDASHLKEPDEVAAAAELALFDSEPKRRYMVVPAQNQAEWTIKAEIAQLVQLNEGQAYSYDRDALIKLLDESLAHSRPSAK